MGTVRRIDDNRGVAVRRYQHGESVRSIAMSLGRSRWWVYKWLARAATGGPAWATDRSRRLDVFGERFLVPPEAQYAYVVGTVDVARQRLTVTLAGDLIAEWPYPLRCRPLREC